MSKTLIIHIGHFKTGTTALQVFFDGQRGFLAKHGLEYPDVWFDHSKHSDFAFSILRAAGISGPLMYGYGKPTPPAEMWGDLFRHIDEKGGKRTLISSEEFMRIGQFPAAVDILRDVLADRPADLDVRIVAYLRDPASHLRSWYNQLIKMNFPVSDMGTALDGDIEAIHYDYHRALGPWIGILGADNVTIRPYRNDRDDPGALHRDFFDILGIALPGGLIGAQVDPNPRLDDRVAELVRLMQNMALPSASINAVRKQALAYVAAQDAIAPRDAATIDDVRARSRAGIEWLAGQPGSTIPAEDFAAHLPEAGNRTEVDRTMLLGFVMFELIQLRQRFNKSNVTAMESRIAALEARLGTQGDTSSKVP